jgi:hypothetical protein
MDFLKHFQLLVNPAAGTLLDSTAGPVAVAATPVSAMEGTHVQVTTCSDTASMPVEMIEPLHAKPQLQPPPPRTAADCAGVAAMLLAKYAAVFNSSSGLPAATHDVEHYLVTKGPPIGSKFRRLDGEKLAAARAEFEKMEQEGVVRRSTSPWASPLHMVEKPMAAGAPAAIFGDLI